MAGITAVGEGTGAGSASDYGLTTGGPVSNVMSRYEALSRSVGFRSSVVGRQVHGTRVVEAQPSRLGGPLVVDAVDGLVTSEAGVLLAVTAADCVPVFVADPAGRCIAVLHAGWRGASAGILEVGLTMLERRFTVDPSDLAVFLGPSICESCYEVGADVLQAFGRDSSRPTRLDLRGELAQRAVTAGVAPARVSKSGWCTRCGPHRLHSHRARGPEAGRMAAFLGMVPAASIR